jgi:hypothetical protein
MATAIGPIIASVNEAQVRDLGQAKQWYSGLPGKQPVLDAPFAVAFSLMLVPAANARPGIDERVVAYWGVSNIDEVRSGLLESGAEPHGEVTSFGDTRFAWVVGRGYRSRLSHPAGWTAGGALHSILLLRPGLRPLSYLPAMYAACSFSSLVESQRPGCKATR